MRPMPAVKRKTGAYPTLSMASPIAARPSEPTRNVSEDNNAYCTALNSLDVIEER